MGIGASPPGAGAGASEPLTMRYTLNGIGPWLVSLYLTEVGGQETAPGQVIGAGWQARVWAGEPFRIGALTLGVTEVELCGEADAVRAVVAAFEKKVLRAGG